MKGTFQTRMASTNKANATRKLMFPRLQTRLRLQRQRSELHFTTQSNPHSQFPENTIQQACQFPPFLLKFPQFHSKSSSTVSHSIASQTAHISARNQRANTHTHTYTHKPAAFVHGQSACAFAFISTRDWRVFFHIWPEPSHNWKLLWTW